MTGVWSSIRYLLADFIGDDDAAPPFLPDGLPDAVAPIASEAIERGKRCDPREIGLHLGVRLHRLH